MFAYSCLDVNMRILKHHLVFDILCIYLVDLNLDLFEELFEEHIHMYDKTADILALPLDAKLATALIYASESTEKQNAL